MPTGVYKKSKSQIEKICKAKTGMKYLTLKEWLIQKGHVHLLHEFKEYKRLKRNEKSK